MTDIQQLETCLHRKGYILFRKAMPTTILGGYIMTIPRYSILQASDMTLAAGCSECMTEKEVAAFAQAMK